MIARRILVISRTANLVREVQAAVGSGCVLTHHDHAADVEEFVSLKGPFDALVAGPLFDTKTGLDRLRRLRADAPELPIVLVLPSPARSPLPDIVRVGATDLVEMPTDRRRLGAALRRALDAARMPVPVPSIGDSGHDTPLAEVFSIASPSGGCGKTFYSTNLAYFLHHQTGRRVCLVDLDLQFGEVSAALRLKPHYTMVDAVARAEEEQEDLDAYIEEYLLTHSSGFWVLPAPRHPAEADRIGPPDVAKIIESLRRHFDYLVLDTSAQLSEVVLTALDQSTSLVCMATLDLPSIRNMRVFLDTLERLKIPTERISVILNKVEPDMGIKVEEADEALYHKVVSVLPYAREVSRSINQGLPVIVSDPRSDISVKLATGMRARIDSASSLTEFPPPPPGVATDGAGHRKPQHTKGGRGRRSDQPRRRIFGAFSRTKEERA